MRFRLLGAVEADVAGQPLPLGWRQERCILALLLLEAGRSVPLERLADLLWDGEPPADARRTVQVAVSRLRARLTAAGAAEHDVHLITQGSAYVLRVEPARVDVHRFRSLVEQARAARDPEDGLARLREALALWRGPALADVAGDRLRQRVAAPLEDERLAALEDLMDLELAAGRHQQVVAELASLVADHQLRERLSGQLMLALYRTGRQVEALGVYRDLRRALRDTFALEPGEPLQRLHQRMLRGDPTLDGSAPTRPGPAGPPGVPRQLPTDVSGFIGRDAQLKVLDGLLSYAPVGPVGVATIVGTAGVGKTSLAVRWAHAVAANFPDGQLYVNLRGFDPTGPVVPPDEVLRGFLIALGLPPQRLPTSLEELAGLYRSQLAGRRVLVVLDNARDAPQVRPLLPGASRCLVVVTSRDQLTGLVAIDGAQPIAMDVLDPDEAYDLLVRRLGSARLAAEPAAVDEIITRCARLPLALAVTAARAALRPELALAVLAAELRDAQTPLDALGGEDPASDVRAALACSYAALSGQAAELFRRLGQHVGPDLAVPAVASLAGRGVAEVRPLLAELAATNLINEHRPGRYAFHDLLRAYAADLAERLDPGPDRRQATMRLVDHYVHSADAANRQFGRDKHLSIDPPPPDPAVTIVEPADDQQALAWFDAELAGLVAVADHVATTGLDEHTIAFAAILETYLERRGRWHLWMAAERAAIAAAERLGDVRTQADAHACVASVQDLMGDPEESVRTYARAIALYPDEDTSATRGELHLGLGSVLNSLGRLDDAQAEVYRALALFQAAGDRNREAAALNDAGWNHYLAGQPEHALAHCERGLALFEEVGNRVGQAFTLDSMGQAHHQLGHEREASECHQRSLALLRELGARYPEATILTHIGDCHDAGGRVTEARAAWREALTILEDLDHPDADEVRAKLRS